MQLQPLLDALGGDAARQVQAIAEAALAEAARIRTAAEANVSQRCEAALALRETQLRNEADSRRAEALREARTAVLQARDVFLIRVFDAATSCMPGVLQQRTDVLAQFAGEALDYVLRDAVVRCPPDQAEPLRGNDALGKARVEADAEVTDGVIVQATDGSVVIDNTLRNRLRWMRPQLSIELLTRYETGR